MDVSRTATDQSITGELVQQNPAMRRGEMNVLLGDGQQSIQPPLLSLFESINVTINDQNPTGSCTPKDLRISVQNETATTSS